MVSVLASTVIDRGFIGGVMVSMFASCVVDRGFIGGVMVSMFASCVVDRGFIGGVNYPDSETTRPCSFCLILSAYRKKQHMSCLYVLAWSDKNWNPWSTAHEASTLTITPPMNPQSTTLEANMLRTCCLGIRIICPSGATCLPADCCFSDIAL
jgi:hypothetical protein